MMIGKFLARSAVIASIAALFLSGSAAWAAQRDIDMLKSYVGEWRGRGTMSAGGDPETMLCKLDITDTAQTKLTIDGRCSLAGARLSMKGTLAYVPQNNRFEAVMSSNTPYSGQAVGYRRGNRLVFAMQDRDPDTGFPIQIDVNFALIGNGITVDFVFSNPEKGWRAKAQVPFSK